MRGIKKKLQEIINDIIPKKTEQQLVDETKTFCEAHVKKEFMTREKADNILKNSRQDIRTHRDFEKRVLKVLRNAKREINEIKKEFVNSEANKKFPFFHEWF